MTVRAEIKPELLNWAIDRSGVDDSALHKRFPKLLEWQNGTTRPTLKQAEKFAKATHTPIGFLFLDAPPDEQLPIPDYRTIANRQITRPSVDLLDSIYVCQQRQAWYRSYALSNGLNSLPFIGSVDQSAPVEQIAKEIRTTLGFDRRATRCDTRLRRIAEEIHTTRGFDLDARATMRICEEALRSFIDNVDAAGILVMCNGIVLNNIHRKLDTEEFRGFALTDNLAPLIFINGADTRSAQMFTLAHELAHLWLGESALSSADISGREEHTLEKWCNAVAAELLVPMSVFRSALRDEELADALNRLARQFKVSTLVILRRMRDAGYLSYNEYADAYGDELECLLSLPGGSGGDFYLAQSNRLGRRFARALIASTLEGQTLYRDAMRMLGVKKVGTFNELGRRLEVSA